jgi:hypothetical protein
VALSGGLALLNEQRAPLAVALNEGTGGSRRCRAHSAVTPMKTNPWPAMLLSVMLSACVRAEYDAVPSRGISQDITATHFQSGATSVGSTLDFRDTDIRR